MITPINASIMKEPNSPKLSEMTLRIAIARKHHINTNEIEENQKLG